jgi:opacity protein-like surface antigen
MKRICTLALLAILALPFMAQDTPLQQPDLPVAHQEFFDPTRKVKEPYQFSTTWRLEAGYLQSDQRQDTSHIYLHGMRLGATIDFNLPYHFSIQTGLLAALSYTQNTQHWGNVDAETAQINRLHHHIINLQFIVPVRAYYNITLWKQLRMFFFAGPQLSVGAISHDIPQAELSAATSQWLEQQGILLTPYDRYTEKQLYRTNIQFGLGGGFEWDRYRLQAGYDFGLNNICRPRILPSQHINEWSWLLTFSYAL